MINIYCIRPKGFNIGNDVIHLAMNHFIRSSFREPVNIISLPATGKYESQKKAGLNSQTIYEINQFGKGLIIGGGNLYENNELEINPTALKALEVPLMIFSLARGRIFNKDLILVDRTDVMTDQNIRILNEKADLSLSRDRATWRYLQSLGLENTLGGCPTLFMNEIPQHLIPVSESSQTDALISIRTPTLMSVPVSFQYSVREIMVELISLLKDKGYQKIRILCHDHRDIPFADSFRDLEYLYTDDVYAYLTYLRNTRLNITFRLHSFLPAIAYNVPAIKISYDERALSMLETIGLDEWNINLVKDNVVEELKKRLNSLEELEKLKSKLRNTLWKEIHDTIVHGFAQFAKLIK